MTKVALVQTSSAIESDRTAAPLIDAARTPLADLRPSSTQPQEKTMEQADRVDLLVSGCLSATRL
jgi:hypothetical protein